MKKDWRAIGLTVSEFGCDWELEDSTSIERNWGYKIYISVYVINRGESEWKRVLETTQHVLLEFYKQLKNRIQSPRDKYQFELDDVEPEYDLYTEKDKEFPIVPFETLEEFEKNYPFETIILE